MAVPLAPAACSVCARWTSTVLVRVEGEGRWAVADGGPAPRGPSAYLCLQIVPQLLGLRPRISRRRRPPPRELRLGHLQGPAVLQAWAGPRTVGRGPGPAGGESLPDPMLPRGWPHAAGQGRCVPWGPEQVLKQRSAPAGRAPEPVSSSTCATPAA